MLWSVNVMRHPALWELHPDPLVLVHGGGYQEEDDQVKGNISCRTSRWFHQEFSPLPLFHALLLVPLANRIAGGS